MWTFSQLEHRVDYFWLPREESVADVYEGIIASVLNGSHVIIYSKSNLESMLNKIYKEKGDCDMATKDDFRRSRDPVFSTTTSWIYRCNKRYTVIILFKVYLFI
jgi:hypothetical protein